MVSLRLAGPEDCRSVAHIEYLSIQHEPRLYPLHLGQDDFERIWRERLNSRRYTTLIASSNEVDCGLLALVRQEQDGFIQALYVHPDYFRRKVATSLILTAEELLRQRGYRRLLLNVEPQNHQAIALYRSLSFTGNRPEHATHLIRMLKQLQ